MSRPPATTVSNTIEDGVFFNAVVQGREVTVVLPAPVSPALWGLPPASATFTGRDPQLQALRQSLAPNTRTQRTVLVSAVAGMAGVGKTELVVQAARWAVGRPGWFPGGALFVDMFGYDSQRRMSAADALVGLLQALGMPGEHIPNAEQDRSRLLRSALAAFAAQGRRILLVIDNAASADQVIPLLPADPGHRRPKSRQGTPWTWVPVSATLMYSMAPRPSRCWPRHCRRPADRTMRAWIKHRKLP